MKRFSILSAILVLCITSIYAQRIESSYHVQRYRGKDAEEIAKQYLDNRTYPQPIEGIWQSSDGYVYFIEKDSENGIKQTDQFRMIVLESSFDGWERGDVKAFIRFGSVDNIYTMKYWTKNSYGYDPTSQQTVLIYENDALMSFQRIDSQDKIRLFRQYPTIDPSDIDLNDNSNEESKQWSGSGVAIATNYVATNYHVVEDAKTLAITNVNSDKSSHYNVEVVATDKFNDLAIVKVNDSSFKGFSTIQYGFDADVRDIGTDVFVLGYPLINTMGDDLKLTNGIISSKTGYKGDVSLYQISAPIQPGNSGGPLFDSEGNLIGIVNAKHRGAENVGYAIKLSYLQNLIASSNLPIELKSTNCISNLSLAEKVKKISSTVVCIRANMQEDDIEKHMPQVTQIKKYKPQDIAKAEKLYYSTWDKTHKEFYMSALKDIKKSIELYPAECGIYTYGWLCAETGDTIEAINSFKHLVKQKNTSWYLYHLIGKIYDSEKHPAEALKYYKQILEKDPNRYECYVSMGLCNSSLRNNEECINNYKDFLKYESYFDNINYPTAYNNIAWAYCLMGDIETARPYIDKALSKRTVFDFIWDTDGEIAYKSGDYVRCIRSMNNAIAISKINGEEQAKRTNAYRYRGLAHLQLGDTARAYYDFLHTTNDSLIQATLQVIGKYDTTGVNTSTVITRPKYKYRANKHLTIESIEITNECTIVKMSIVDPQMTWYAIKESSCLYDNVTKKKCPLIGTDNCKISDLNASPTIIHDNKIGEKQTFTLYFQRVPDYMNIVNFIEPGDSDWFISGIKLKRK